MVHSAMVASIASPIATRRLTAVETAEKEKMA